MARDSCKWVSYKKWFGCWWVVVGVGGHILAGGGWWWVYFGWWWGLLDCGGWRWMVVGSGIVYSDPLKRINLILRSIWQIWVNNLYSFTETDKVLIKHLHQSISFFTTLNLVWKYISFSIKFSEPSVFYLFITRD